MIFVSVGTEKFAFDRLLKLMDELRESNIVSDKIFAQIGHSLYQPKNFDYERFISFDKMVDYIKKANILIFHAGVGSVFLSFSLGKRPIIFPRRHEFNEHLDSHQVEFANKLKFLGKAFIANDKNELIKLIKGHNNIQAETIYKSPEKLQLLSYLENICES